MAQKTQINTNHRNISRERVHQIENMDSVISVTRDQSENNT